MKAISLYYIILLTNSCYSELSYSGFSDISARAPGTNIKPKVELTLLVFVWKVENANKKMQLGNLQ